MSNINTAKALLRQMITPENPTHIQDIVQAFVDEGVIIPDLPEHELWDEEE